MSCLRNYLRGVKFELCTHSKYTVGQKGKPCCVRLKYGAFKEKRESETPKIVGHQ